MRTIAKDEIVESRVWSGGVEIVSRMNWSHLARVRRSLDLALAPGPLANLRQFEFSRGVKLTVAGRSRRARIRVA